MPEFTAPGLGRESNTVEIDWNAGDNASGVLYALGGSGGGLTLLHGQGPPRLLYNMMIIDRSIAKSAEKIAPGKHTIVVAPRSRPQSPAPRRHRAQRRWQGSRSHLHRQRKFRRTDLGVDLAPISGSTRLPRLLRTKVDRFKFDGQAIVAYRSLRECPEVVVPQHSSRGNPQHRQLSSLLPQSPSVFLHPSNHLLLWTTERPTSWANDGQQL
jgi:hypothetical protein